MDKPKILSTEIVVQILLYLPPKAIAKCRRVCRDWRDIVDNILYKNNLLWQRRCQESFIDIYDQARRKMGAGVTYFQLYRSLSLWKFLLKAREEINVVKTLTDCDVFMGMELLKNGVVALHSFYAISYYEDCNFVKQKKRIAGKYYKYVENNDLLVILTLGSCLVITFKTIYEPLSRNEYYFHEVRFFVLHKRSVYYVSLDNNVHVCKIVNGTVKSHYLFSLLIPIMGIAYTDKVCVVTENYRLYSFDDDILSTEICLEPYSLEWLWKYNFLGSVDVKVYYTCCLNHSKLQEVSVLFPYRDLMFVGTNWGTLSVYYLSDFTKLKFKPIKQWRFVENRGLEKENSIIKIDVMEQHFGHTIFVMLTQKLITVDFKYNGLI